MFTTIPLWFGLPVLLAAAHYIGDFAWQSTWMAMEKGKNWDALLAHCATYTAAFVLFACLPHSFTMGLGATVAIFTTHIVIDLLKARFNVIKSIMVDQFCHFAVLATLLLAGLIR